MVALAESEALDEVLTAIMTNDKSIMIGFSFGSDEAVFKKSCPNLSFYTDMSRIVDAQTIYSKVVPEAKEIGLGLSKVCEHVLKAKLCKGEQMSNWELRPLR